jgi:hypothetical protein
MSINFLAQTTADTVIFDSVIDLLVEFGFFRVVMPFLLVFAITYGIILKTKILGEPEEGATKSIAAIISMALGFFIISSKPVVNALSILIPQAAFLLILLLFILLILAFIGFPIAEGISDTKWWMYIVVIGVILIFFGMVDVATEFEIPIIHQIVSFFTGAQIATATSAATNSILALIVILVFMFAIVAYVIKSA